MNIIVTGAAGFIGSNLCQILLKKGHNVLAIDNFSIGNKKTIEPLEKNKRFKFYKADIEKKLPKLPQKIDAVVHLAAKKIPRYENSLTTLTANTKMTSNMLELTKNKKAKFVYASTSDVYGLSNDIPFTEESNLVLGPSTVSRWAYAVSKIYDEHLSFAYSDKYKFPVVILRFFGIYGPGVNLSWWGGPFGPFVDAIFKNQTIEVHGDGLQARCFTYIDDLVNGIYLSIKSKKANNNIINVASPEKTSIIALVRRIEKISGKKAKIKYIPYSSFYGGKYQDIMNKIPDVKKSKELLGFEAKIGLGEGIKNTINWYSQQL